MALSQNGFPALDSGSEGLHKWMLPSTKRYFVLRRGSPGFLLMHLTLWFDENLENLNEPGEPWDEWAYAYRPVRDSNDLSNHSSGTAVDLNATKHPLGKDNTFSNVQETKIRKRLKFYQDCIRWGGDYSGRKDEMHFEINRSIISCEKRAKELIDTPIGRRVLTANPGQKRVILS